MKAVRGFGLHSLAGGPDLSNLKGLFLWNNSLTRPIPAEMGRLSSLEELWLSDNYLTGQIPPELGNLSSLRDLWLNDNSLIGRIPPDLGRLSNLRDLGLANNFLTGPIPPELGSLLLLDWLDVSETSSLGGPLPEELVGLDLATFRWYDTNLCAPDDPAFLSWLTSIRSHSPPARWRCE